MPDLGSLGRPWSSGKKRVWVVARASDCFGRMDSDRQRAPAGVRRRHADGAGAAGCSSELFLFFAAAEPKFQVDLAFDLAVLPRNVQAEEIARLDCLAWRFSVRWSGEGRRRRGIEAHTADQPVIDRAGDRQTRRVGKV